MIKTQKPISFINKCGALVDYKELESAVLWYAKTPVASKKHIYIFGNYPAVSIHKEKIHIHRLLMMYWIKGDIPIDHCVHHIDKNKLNSTRENLSLMPYALHQQYHNKGKIISDMQKQKFESQITKEKEREQNISPWLLQNRFMK